MNAEPEITRHFIEVEKLVASKNPRLLRIIPKFVFSWLKRVVHQDLVNEYIYKYRDLKGISFVEAILKEFGVIIETAGISPTGSVGPMDVKELGELIPSGSRYIIAANHPLGGLDGMALLQVVGKVRPDVVFPVNDLLMSVPGLKPLFVPINKHGKNTENMEIIRQTFASDKTILYFPAGLCSRKQKGGIICDLEWKKSFITQARRYGRDILPVYVSGRNSNFFYNLSNLRKCLGIKANIEMIYLPDEMVRQKDKVIRMIFGKPIPFNSLDDTRTDAQWADYVKAKVYDIGRMAGEQVISASPR